MSSLDQKQSVLPSLFAKRELADGAESIDVIMDLQKKFGIHPRDAEDIVSALEDDEAKAES
jgi:hypothetical protein